MSLYALQHICMHVDAHANNTQAYAECCLFRQTEYGDLGLVGLEKGGVDGKLVAHDTWRGPNGGDRHRATLRGATKGLTKYWRPSERPPTQ
eukprot:138273-Alexandrium_andersonii.AAC.1